MPLSVAAQATNKPEIVQLSRNSALVGGGQEIVVEGRNFTPDLELTLGGDPIQERTIDNSSRLRFIVPAFPLPASKVLTIKTSSGIAQRRFLITAKPLSELNPLEITTIAGGGIFLGDGGSATSEDVSVNPLAVAVDSNGNALIADGRNNRIRRVEPVNSIITTLAGQNSLPSFGGDGGSAARASLFRPRSIAIDRSGNILFLDSGNSRIRRIDRNSGTITTVAGSSIPFFFGDGGPATSAGLGSTLAIALDQNGNIYIATDNRIRRVDVQTGIINTVAGIITPGFTGDNGPAINASLNRPSSVAVDNLGNFFIADTGNNRIRRVDISSGIITTIAGNGARGFSGDGTAAINAALNSPSAVVIDDSGNLLVADSGNNRVRKVDLATGIITTIVGNGNAQFSGDGMAALNTGLNPISLNIDANGNLLIVDGVNSRVVRVDRSSIVTTLAGNGQTVFTGDGGLAGGAIVNQPRGVDFDAEGNLLIADSGNSRIRKIDITTGIITTVVGKDQNLSAGDGGAAKDATLADPFNVTTDKENNIYISEGLRNKVRVVDARTGIITTLAGTGMPSFSGDGGPAAMAGLDTPADLTVDRLGNLLIADTVSSTIRQVNRNRIISTIVGNGMSGFNGDNLAATTTVLNNAFGIAFDLQGNLYIADSLNNRVRKVDATTMIVTTIAGNGRPGSTGDNGPAKDATLANPYSVAIDPAGNIFVSEFLNHRIRRIDARTGVITTIAGNSIRGFSGDGNLAKDARLANPADIAFDKNGNLYIAEFGNNVIRVIKAVGEVVAPQVTITAASYTKPTFIITGNGFGISGVKVTVNGTEVSTRITTQTESQITLKGARKKLNIKRGANEIVVSVNGVASNRFTFNF